nr:TPA_asm: RNA-dependent polymerase [Halia narna-like virus]|mmetsp:Transcript_19116/g.44541  ORF Transcript_19116/g.44541 Transcript_19116/m.44541 type:complete len:771 (+) Transcript_19116:168-2480(+)
MTSRLAWEKLVAKESDELRDLVKGLDCVITIVVKGRHTKYRSKMCRWAVALYEHVYKAGPEPATRMRAAKDYFTQCRLRAIEGRFGSWGEFPQVPFRSQDETWVKRQILHQISRTARSLREADAKVVSDSLETHFELSTREFETPENLRTSFADFCADRFGGGLGGSLGAVGPSSSFLKKRSDGGAPDEIREITDNFRKREVSPTELDQVVRLAYDLDIGREFKIVNTRFISSISPPGGRSRRFGLFKRYPLEDLLFPFEKEYEIKMEDWINIQEILFSVVACREAVGLTDLPKCRQVPVVERGWKVRVCTPLEAAHRYLLGVINSALLDALERVPEVVGSLHGNAAEKLDWSKGRRTNLVFSADLKSATDYLPQDLVLAAANRLSEGWPPFWAKLFTRAVGPHILTSADGKREQVTSRGILMGSPVSWPLLSMYSAWLHHESGSDGWYGVCGDDYIGCHTYGTYRKYLAVRSATGGVGSPGKDALGTQSVGVFAEELVTVGRCRWIPTVSVRAVMADPKSGLPSWSQGPAVSAALDPLKWDPGTVRRVCSHLHKATYKHLYRAGIEPTGPRWVGCAGFPGLPSKNGLYRARVMASQSSDIVIKWVTHLEMVWNAPVDVPAVRKAIDKEFGFRQYDFLTYRKPLREGEGFGPLRDVISSRAAQLSWPFFLGGATQRLPSRPSLARVKRVIHRVISEITERGRWLSAEEVIHSPEGICTLLDQLEPRCRQVPFRSYQVFFELDGDWAGKTPSNWEEDSVLSWETRKRFRFG